MATIRTIKEREREGWRKGGLFGRKKEGRRPKLLERVDGERGEGDRGERGNQPFSRVSPPDLSIGSLYKFACRSNVI